MRSLIKLVSTTPFFVEIFYWVTYVNYPANRIVISTTEDKHAEGFVRYFLLGLETIFPMSYRSRPLNYFSQKKCSSSIEILRKSQKWKLLAKSHKKSSSTEGFFRVRWVRGLEIPRELHMKICDAISMKDGRDTTAWTAPRDEYFIADSRVAGLTQTAFKPKQKVSWRMAHSKKHWLCASKEKQIEQFVVQFQGDLIMTPLLSLLRRVCV